MEWLGNGLTKGQLVGEHTTDYLDTAELDVPVTNPLEVEQKVDSEECIANNAAEETQKQKSVNEDCVKKATRATKESHEEISLLAELSEKLAVAEAAIAGMRMKITATL